tara:strand:- start:953 stop:1444 length:492 start_codon:yes stop_codon:yes gene_type:complete
MTPKEMADEQIVQLLKDYPTHEDLTNSIKKGEWEEIKGGYIDSKTGRTISDLEEGLGHNWNPILEDYGVSYIVYDDHEKVSAIGQYFDFGEDRPFHGPRGIGCNHRHLNVNATNYVKILNTQDIYDYEALQSGSWSTRHRFFLYAPSKWLTINWRNNPFEVSK